MARSNTVKRHAGRSTWGLVALIAMGIAALIVVILIVTPHLLDPPSAQLKEVYQEHPGGPTFDHVLFDQLLKRHVDEHGGVDYANLAQDAAALDQYIAALGSAPFDEMGRSEKLALLINAYNACTLRLILDYWDGGKLASIKDIPTSKRWDDKRWKVGRYTWSLSEIEHEQIRPKFREPRIHFALVCAAFSCPKLRNEAYRADQLERQLDDQARYTHSHDRWFRFDPAKGEVFLTKLYHPSWYGSDFDQVAGSVFRYASRYAPQLKQALDAGRRPSVHWLNYDWALNRRANPG